MPLQRKGTRLTGIVGSALLLALLVPSPALARQDPGGPIISVPVRVGPQCLLMRIGDQLIRCDSLTGAGTRAPLWVPEQN